MTGVANSWSHGCNHPGCPELVPRGESLCVLHKKAKQKKLAQSNREKNPREQKFYNSKEWVTLSRNLRVNEPFCRMCANEGRQSFGYVTDHIIPLKMSWERRLDPSNLQTLCRICDGKKRANEAKMYKEAEQAYPKCTVVYGPIGAGKTTYVRKNMKRGEVILDLDLFYEALTGAPHHDKSDELLSLVLEAFNQVVSIVARRGKQRPRLWIVTCDLGEERRCKFLSMFPGCEFKVVATEASVCVDRVSKDPFRRSEVSKYKGLIERWWSNYSKEESDAD